MSESTSVSEKSARRNNRRSSRSSRRTIREDKSEVELAIPSRSLSVVTHRRVLYRVDEPLLQWWVEWWLAASAIICIIDVTYTELRPYTQPGGVLGHAFSAWNLYSSVDKHYRDPSDIPTMATGRVMMIEIVLNFIALIMARVRSRHTVVTAFMTTCFVFWKTVFFFAMFIKQPEGTPPFIEPTAPWWKVLLVFVLPNQFWVTCPFIVMCGLWSKLIPKVEEETIKEYRAN